MEGLAGDAVPAFVPVSVESDAGPPSGGANGAEGVVGIEIGEHERVPSELDDGMRAGIVGGHHLHQAVAGGEPTGQAGPQRRSQRMVGRRGHARQQ